MHFRLKLGNDCALNGQFRPREITGQVRKFQKWITRKEKKSIVKWVKLGPRKIDPTTVTIEMKIYRKNHLSTEFHMVKYANNSFRRCGDNLIVIVNANVLCVRCAVHTDRPVIGFNEWFDLWTEIESICSHTFILSAHATYRQKSAAYSVSTKCIHCNIDGLELDYNLYIAHVSIIINLR